MRILGHSICFVLVVIAAPLGSIKAQDQPGHLQELYGMESEFEPTRVYAAQCLIARRLVEGGVRFVELTCPQLDGDRWD